DDLTGQPWPHRPPPATGGGNEPGLHPDQPGGAAAGLADHPHAADRLLAGSAVLGKRLRPVCLALHTDPAGAAAGSPARLSQLEKRLKTIAVGMHRALPGRSIETSQRLMRIRAAPCATARATLATPMPALHPPLSVPPPHPADSGARLRGRRPPAPQQ